jgi:tetratricopeptide (TPR) repeat protein
MTLAIYWQAGNHRFLSLDDNVYVTNNPHVIKGITGQNIIRAFTSVEAGNWHPVTWLSHLTDVQLFGMNPRGHHFTSVAIHTLSTLLLFFLLYRLTTALWQSFFVAALFALHPMHVESVAWVAERKDVLSALFWFITLLFYAGYVAKRKTTLYILSLFSFALGLMSKPMLVTLPLIMLLLDFWPLDRYRHEEKQGVRWFISKTVPLVIEKIPFFICSLLSGIVTIYAQGKGGAIAAFTTVSLQLRIENALVSYLKYISKTLWPLDLGIYYPLPLYIPRWQVISSIVVLLLISAAAIRVVRRYPYLATGWLWFVITLVPVIGLMQVGSQSMADRYSYIPLIGLFIMVAWGVSDLAKSLPYRKVILATSAAAAIIASAAVTWHQLGYWNNDISIYRHTLQITTGNYMINNNLGFALQAEGRLNEAIEEYQKAIRANPSYKKAHYNLGVALDSGGDLDGAINEFRLALQIDPNYTDASNNLGVALANKGYLNAAIQEFQQALLKSPNNTSLHYNLGLVFAGRGDLDGAIRQYKEALRLSPDNTNAQINLEQALTRKSHAR